jgi:hypothetical protein
VDPLEAISAPFQAIVLGALVNQDGSLSQILADRVPVALAL